MKELQNLAKSPAALYGGGVLLLVFLVLVFRRFGRCNIKYSKHIDRLDDMQPRAAAAARKTICDLEKKGIPVAVVSTLRTFEEQQRLYNQGRTTAGSIVTNAPPGTSYHNYGLAVDLAPLKNGVIDWQAPKEKWEAIGRAGKANGFTWGGDWPNFKDMPHLQFDNRGKTTIADLKKKMPNGYKP